MNVALLGYGYVGRTFHAPLIAATDGLHLAAVGSSDPAKVHADWPGLPVGPAAEVLARPDVDLVVIATPNDTHHDLARRALEAGKHVVVDKPFTVTLDEALDLARRARERGRLLSVFHNLRWNADFLTVRALIDEGRLGHVVHFESHFDRYRPIVRARWREQAVPGSGIWYDLGSHLLDQALVLFGLPLAVYADLAQQRRGAQAIDYFHVVLRYDRRRVILHGTNLAAGGSPRFVIHGDAASYVKHGLDTQEDALRAGARPGSGHWGHDPLNGTLFVGQDDAIERVDIPTRRGDWRQYYCGVRDAILTRAPSPVPIEDAVAVMALLELAIESASARAERPIDPTRFAL